MSESENKAEIDKLLKSVFIGTLLSSGVNRNNDLKPIEKADFTKLLLPLIFQDGISPIFQLSIIWLPNNKISFYINEADGKALEPIAHHLKNPKLNQKILNSQINATWDETVSKMEPNVHC
ncbi:unnamed protein product [Schistosoma turkestanicum]|nr:unnamed protein product [Schistosoma turkestanicum]